VLLSGLEAVLAWPCRVRVESELACYSSFYQQPGPYRWGADGNGSNGQKRIERHSRGEPHF